MFVRDTPLSLRSETQTWSDDALPACDLVLIIPQTEHASFSEAMARNWGNAQFEKPAIDFESFCLGIKGHDDGYGPMDNRPVPGMTPDLRLQTYRNLVDHELDDPIANLVAKYHVQRLLQEDVGANPPLKEQLDKCTRIVTSETGRLGLSPETFLWADRITNFCDTVSFRFCLAQDSEFSVSIFPKTYSAGEVSVKFRIKSERAGGHVFVDPWPFAVPQFEGAFMAYDASSYSSDTPKPYELIYRLQSR